MSYCLRLVSDEGLVEQKDSVSPRLARQILGAVELSKVDFSKCLQLCNAQGILTPEHNYWDFAKKNMSHFNFLFQSVNTRAGHEEGLLLANIFIMLVYLRVMASSNGETCPDLYEAALQSKKSVNIPEQLSPLVDKFTSSFEAPVRRAPNPVPKAEVNTRFQFDFHNRIRSILGL